MEAPDHDSPRRNTMWRRLATLAILAALLGLAVMALPRGFDTDLTRIGSGKPALVFVYDPTLVVSNRQTREMETVREALGDTLHFLIADVGRPDARQLMQQHQAEPTQLLLFAPDGSLLGRMQGLVSAEQLLTSIEAAKTGVRVHFPPLGSGPET